MLVHDGWEEDVEGHTISICILKLMRESLERSTCIASRLDHATTTKVNTGSRGVGNALPELCIMRWSQYSNTGGKLGRIKLTMR